MTSSAGGDDAPQVAITVRGFCDGSDRASVTIGPRSEGDMAVLVREAQQECQAALAVSDASTGGRGPRYLCSGVFVEGPLGLKLAATDVRALAQSQSAISVRLFRNAEIYRARVTALHDDEDLERYLPPADGAIPEIEVLFGLRGPELDFEVIGARLGLEPSYTSVPSRPFSSEGEARRRQWVLSSGPLHAISFQEPLERLFQQIVPLSDTIRTLAHEAHLEPSVDLVVLEYSDRVPSLTLRPDHLQALADFDGRLWFDIL
jgi:hypothetical protein